MNIQQLMAQEAFNKAKMRSNNDNYLSFARGFPSLIHSCGLVQAVSFAKAKANDNIPHGNYLSDLKDVLKAGKFEFASQDVVDLARSADQSKYLLLSRRTLEAAIWLKRYAEALESDKTKS